jgi:hypothetical protein
VSPFVIDARIAIKWVVDEPGTPEALLLRRHRLLAIELLIAEPQREPGAGGRTETRENECVPVDGTA